MIAHRTTTILTVHYMYGTKSKQAFHGRAVLIISGNCFLHSATAPTKAGRLCVFDPTFEC
jgi:hypothetical protein